MQSFQRVVTQTLNPVHRWLLPAGAICTFVGYVRPWIDHKAAGLAVLGLDLGELVKFLHPVQQGEIRLWREGFYLPLVAVSVSLSLNACRRDSNSLACADLQGRGTEPDGSGPRYSWPVRIAYLLFAMVTALNLLPPAWTPQQLLTPEFRLQAVAMLLCLALAAISPVAGLFQSPQTLLASLGRTTDGSGRRGCLWRVAWVIAFVRGLVLVILVGAAIYFPVAQFREVLPTLAELYGQTPEIGWGPALMVAGLAGLLWHGINDVSSLLRE
ncbi:MAG: hypothetical protein OXF54_00860 [Caldilineaceae bacterium]|nr:hypothetical protein [Caldilineaceae bacterium]